MPNSTPLRYPGGKARLRPYIDALITQNKLLDIHYVEPFCGGAGLALELLFASSVAAIHLNDLDRAVFAFWHCVLNETDQICEKILTTPCSMETWYVQREVWQSRNAASISDLGFATFFLNRTNRSGILGAGVIGGKSQHGKWKIDARYNRAELITRIKRISEYKSRIFLYNKEAREFLSEVAPSLPDGTLVYLDPPYVEKGPGLYLNHYDIADHKALAAYVTTQLDHPWMVSYDDHPLIREYYGQSSGISMSLPYSAYGNARRGTEVFFFSKNLMPPQMSQRASRYRKPWKV